MLIVINYGFPAWSLFCVTIANEAKRHPGLDSGSKTCKASLKRFALLDSRPCSSQGQALRGNDKEVRASESGTGVISIIRKSQCQL